MPPLKRTIPAGEQHSSALNSGVALLPDDTFYSQATSSIRDSDGSSQQGPAISRPHTKFIPVYVHTAKCDGCDQRNSSVIQRCTTCNLQICKACVYGKMKDGIHTVNEGDVNWTPRKSSEQLRACNSSMMSGRAKKSMTTLITVPKSRIEKRKRILKIPTIERVRFAQKLKQEMETREDFFVGSQTSDCEPEERDDDFDFGGLPSRRLALYRNFRRNSRELELTNTPKQSPEPTGMKRKMVTRGTTVEVCREKGLCLREAFTPNPKKFLVVRGQKFDLFKVSSDVEKIANWPEMEIVRGGIEDSREPCRSLYSLGVYDHSIKDTYAATEHNHEALEAARILILLSDHLGGPL